MLRREVHFEPGRDYTKRYGRSGLSIRFLVIGEQGAVQFVILTDWMPTEQPSEETCHLFPMAADVGYHAQTPQYEGQKRMEECPLIPGGKCYYDGSGLRAEKFLRVLRTRGHEPVWEMLEAEYRDRFGTEEV